MNNIIKCPHCGEVCDNDIYISKKKCSECGKFFQLEQTSVSTMKETIASENASARRKYRQAKTINNTAKSTKTVATVNEKNATELYNRSQELQKKQSPPAPAVPVATLPPRKPVANPTENTVNMNTTAQITLSPEPVQTIDANLQNIEQVRAYADTPHSTSVVSQVPVQIVTSTPVEVYPQEQNTPISDSYCEQEVVSIPDAVMSQQITVPAQNNQTSQPVENPTSVSNHMSSQTVNISTQIPQSTVPVLENYQNNQKPVVPPQQNVSNTTPVPLYPAQNEINTPNTTFMKENGLNGAYTLSYPDNQGSVSTASDMFTNWNQVPNIKSETESGGIKLNNLFKKTSNKKDREQPKKECPLDYNFNYDNYYDDTEPLEPALADVLTTKTIMKISGIIVGIIGATVFLILYA